MRNRVLLKHYMFNQFGSGIISIFVITKNSTEKLNKEVDIRRIMKEEPNLADNLDCPQYNGGGVKVVR